MKKILTIAGTRPQLVKVAAVSRELREEFTEVLVNTGQHYDYNMAGIFFEELNIPKPDYDLGVGSMSHAKQTAQMMMKIEDVIDKESPDGIVVYGDTNSTLAATIVASKLHIPIFHIEAGLRSYNKKMPEEVNRVMTDHVSELLFAPTDLAVKNLEKESITKGVHQVGDVMYDAVLYNMSIAEEKYELETFELKAKEYILGTIHRAENTGNKDTLSAIVESLLKVNTTVFLPLHPGTKSKLTEYSLLEKLEKAKHIILADPVSYLEMLLLEKNAKAIITDSGGVQKEAYFVKVPCYTLRPETEWIETVETGWNKLVNPLSDDLSSLINDFKEPPYIDNLYGDGNASQNITEKILKYFNKR